jgi:hypothetical protein
MGKLHSETVASYVIDNREVDVVLCWQGKEPEDDPDRACLNEGEPWHDDGRGHPTADDVATLLAGGT